LPFPRIKEKLSPDTKKICALNQCQPPTFSFVPVIASLVVGSDGSTSKDGRSAGVSSAADRRAFLARRRQADALLIGGNTARNEPYQKTPVPVVVVSKSMLNPLSNNRLAHWWNCDPVEALSRAQRLFGETIVIESGISIIEELLAAKKIDRLELSVTAVTEGEDQVDYKKLLSKFTSITERVEEDTTFYTATN
jgi:riboflavin biosynthesis pyrimidine reductase